MLWIAHLWWRASAPRQHVLPGRARIHQLLSGSAPALRRQHHMPSGLHLIHLRLPALRLRSACIVALPPASAAVPPHRTTMLPCPSPQPPRPACLRASPPCALRRSTSARLHARESPKSRLIVQHYSLPPAQQIASSRHFRPRLFPFRPARAQHHHSHRLCRIAAPRHQRLQMLVQHNHRPAHKVRLLPQTRVPAKSRLAARLVQLRLRCNHMRRPLAAQRHSAAAHVACIARRRPLCPPAPCPRRLHITVRERVSRLLRHIYLLRCQLHSAVHHSRTHRQMQPLALALIHCFAGRRAQRWLRLRLRAFAAGCSNSTTFPSSSADCTSLAPPTPLPSCSLAPSLTCSMLCAAAGGAKLASSRSPFAVCRAPVAVVSSISAWPTPLSVRNAEPSPKLPVTSSALILDGVAGALPRWLSLVIVTPPDPRIVSTSNCPSLVCPAPACRPAPLPEPCPARKPMSTTGERHVRLTRSAPLLAPCSTLSALVSSLVISTPRSRCALFSSPFAAKFNSAVGDVPCTLRSPLAESLSGIHRHAALHVPVERLAVLVKLHPRHRRSHVPALRGR